MAEYVYRLDHWDDERLPPELESTALEDWAAFLAAGPRWDDEDERQAPPEPGEHIPATLWTINRTRCCWIGLKITVISGDPLATGPQAMFAVCWSPGSGWGEDDMFGDLAEIDTSVTGFGEFEIASWNDAMTVRTTLVFHPGPPPTLTPIREGQPNG